MLRMPEKLRDRIADAAAQSSRSMNAEIVQRLDLSFIHEIEGRGGDVRSLANEVMELRHAQMFYLMALVNDDKQGFREVLDEMLAKYGIAKPKWPKQGPLTDDEAADLMRQVDDDRRAG